VTALAALCENFIGAESTFVCTGVYEKYASLGYSPRCTGTHGTLTVTDAITASCNLFFYQVGDLIGIEAIDEYATTLGLGQSTGIELYEEEGRVASPETKAQAYANSAVDQEWYAADTLQAAIGQSITGVTPIQLARYCAALANSGTVYNCSLVKSISSYDYSESIFERTPSVFNTLDASDYVWDLIHTGMWGVANSPSGTAYSILGGYEPQVAAKTGTTETGAQTEDAVFICYAPADDPEIAIAVVVEKGKRGAKLADIAKTVLDYYFDFEMSTQQVESELTLLH
jgi:penicillin-binding protein 2